MKRSSMVLAWVAASLTGCGSCAGDSSASKASSDKVPAVSAAPVPSIQVPAKAPDDLPVPAAYAGEVEAQITADNYKSELVTLTREIDGSP